MERTVFDNKVQSETAQTSLADDMIRVRTLIEYADGSQVIVSSLMEDEVRVSEKDPETAVFHARGGRVVTRGGLIVREAGAVRHSFWVATAVAASSAEEFAHDFGEK